MAQHAQTTVILAEDEASLYLQASNTTVWARQGHTPIVRVHPNRDCTHLYGSLNLITGQDIIMRSPKMNGDTTAVYLNQVLHTYPDQPILLLWDRAPHHKGPAISAVLQANPRLEILWFPPGAPDTNPQEHVWKDTRQHVCHAHTFNTLHQVVEAVEHHLLSNTFSSSLLPAHNFLHIHAMFI